MVLNGHAGTNKVKFQGRISRGHEAPPGHLHARDQGGRARPARLQPPEAHVHDRPLRRRRPRGRCRPARRARTWSRRAACAARDFLRAPVLRCSAPRLTALSIVADQLAVRRLGGVAVAALRRRLEAAEVGLDRGGVAAVLEPLALGAQDPLLLGVDVGHGSDRAARARNRPGRAAERRTIAALTASAEASAEEPAAAAARRRAGASPATPRSSRSPRASRASPGWCAKSSPRASSARSGPASAFTIAFQVPNLVTQPVRQRGAVGGVRAGVHRTAAEGPPQRGAAARLDAVLDHADRARRADGVLHPRGRRDHAAVHRLDVQRTSSTR